MLFLDAFSSKQSTTKQQTDSNEPFCLFVNWTVSRSKNKQNAIVHGGQGEKGEAGERREVKMDMETTGDVGHNIKRVKK